MQVTLTIEQASDLIRRIDENYLSQNGPVIKERTKRIYYRRISYVMRLVDKYRSIVTSARFADTLSISDQTFYHYRLDAFLDEVHDFMSAADEDNFPERNMIDRLIKTGGTEISISPKELESIDTSINRSYRQDSFYPIYKVRISAITVRAYIQSALDSYHKKTGESWDKEDYAQEKATALPHPFESANKNDLEIKDVDCGKFCSAAVTVFGLLCVLGITASAAAKIFF